MYWYQKFPGDRALKRIGQVYYSTIEHEESFKDHFNITGDMSGDTAKNGSLFIVNLKAPDHNAVYYCAASYAHWLRIPSPLHKNSKQLLSTFMVSRLNLSRPLPVSYSSFVAVISDNEGVFLSFKPWVNSGKTSVGTPPSVWPDLSYFHPQNSVIHSLDMLPKCFWVTAMGKTKWSIFFFLLSVR